MSDDYQRLQEEVTAVDCEIQESCRGGSAAELAGLERRLDFLASKRGIVGVSHRHLGLGIVVGLALCTLWAPSPSRIHVNRTVDRIRG